MTMDIHEILKRLPHRYPFLLVDRVLELEPGKSIRALKNVTVNEPFFPGHFPARPVMPGVHDPRGAGADRGHPRVRHRRRVPDEKRGSISPASTRRASGARSSPATS